MPTPAEIRLKARAHERDLAAQTRFFTVKDLAARWRCSSASVRSIPAERLPFTAIGRGSQRAHRRYDPADVTAFEHARITAAA